MLNRCRALLDSPLSKPFPKVYFDLKAFRKGISEKKQSLIHAERREIDRVYAKPAPSGWGIERFLKETGLESPSLDKDKFYSELASCFDDWNDFISSSKKDLYRVSNLLNASQVKKLHHYIDLFNHGLFPRVSDEDSVLNGQPLGKQGSGWSVTDDEKLLDLATNKYDFTFGDPWLYIGWEMERSSDEVHERFLQIYTKAENRNRTSEIVISKSFKPLLMNRQFRIIPPQCYMVPSSENFPSSDKNFELPSAFVGYRSDS